jgi:predicted restriction endonuclease
VERLTIQRVGQHLFREALLDYWRGRCPVTGLDVPELLRASHAKPWAACADDNERLDVYNGLLLAPHFDALFDGGWVTFLPTGAMLLSDRLPESALDSLGLQAAACITGLARQHMRYLEFHRSYVFRGAGVASR